ncbi:hypothetical protein [Fusobacterium necrophorum]|uniref:hypothetical protein n=1 Tax=Fusobacterium necrophorum TaxID=859 RepID=UPI0036F2C381
MEVHGKNGLANYSLLESIIFGKRAVRILLEKTPWIRYNEKIRRKRNKIFKSRLYFKWSLDSFRQEIRF